MPFAKIDFNDGSFSTVQVHKSPTGMPYSWWFETVAEGDGFEVVSNYSSYGYQNDWVYVYYTHGNKTSFGTWYLKFNNTIYKLDLKNIVGIEPCTKEFYHQYKEIKGEKVKRGGIRDSQKSKVYRAEHPIKYEGKLEAEEIEEFVLSVLVTDTWSKFNEKFKYQKDQLIKLKLNPRATSSAFGGLGGIDLPDWAKTKTVVIHEMAHVVIQRTYNYQEKKERNIQGHGKEYCFVFVYLLNSILPDLAELLVKSFEIWNVKYLRELGGMSLYEFDNLKKTLDIIDETDTDHLTLH